MLFHSSDMFQLSMKHMIAYIAFLFNSKYYHHIRTSCLTSVVIAIFTGITGPPPDRDEHDVTTL